MKRRRRTARTRKTKKKKQTNKQKMCGAFVINTSYSTAMQEKL